jgi:hypothetical protein
VACGFALSGAEFGESAFLLDDVIVEAEQPGFIAGVEFGGDGMKAAITPAERALADVVFG